MSAAWAGSSAGIIVIGVCGALLWTAGKHGHRLPSQAHPWLYRLLVFGMFTGGDAVAQTALGAYPERLELWALSPLGTAGRHDVLVIAGAILIFATVAGLLFVPNLDIALMAVALPFVLLVTGGALNGFALWMPVVQWSAQVSHWIGG